MAEPPQKRPVKFVASDQDGMPVKRRQVQQACEPCRKRKVRHGCRPNIPPCSVATTLLSNVNQQKRAYTRAHAVTHCLKSSIMSTNIGVIPETLLSRLRHRPTLLRRCVSPEKHICSPPVRSAAARRLRGVEPVKDSSKLAPVAGGRAQLLGGILGPP